MPDTDNELGFLILAGGKSQRMGMDKALLPFQGRTFLECLVDQCQRVSPHVVISVARGHQHSFREKFQTLEPFSRVTWVEDQHEGKGPLAGIEAGLKALEAVCRYAFVMGCDVPVLKPRLVQELLSFAKQHGCRAVTPVEGERTFGMTAVYRTDSWSVAGELIDQESLRVSALAQRLCAHKIELADLREFDPNLTSFLNINDPQAYGSFMSSQGCTVDADLIERLNNGRT